MLFYPEDFAYASGSEGIPMCGRFVCSKAPEVYGSFYDVQAPPIAPNFNLAPTQPVLAVRLRR